MKSLVKWGLILTFTGGSWVGPAISRQATVNAQQQQPDAKKQLATLLAECQKTPPKAPLDRITCNDAEQINTCQKLPKDENARKEKAELVQQCKVFGTLFHLSSIPVFTIIDNEGRQLASGVKVKDKEGKEVTVPVVFYYVSKSEADAQLNARKQGNANAKLHVLPLRLAYQLTSLPNQKVVHQIVPGQQQVAYAKEVLQQKGEDAKNIDIPVFFVEDDKGVLGDQRGKHRIFPFYLDKADVQARFQALKPQNAQAKINTTSLTLVIQNLLENKPITLVPSSSSIQYVQQQIKDTRAKSGQTK